MVGMDPGLGRFWEPHRRDDPGLRRFGVTEVLGFGPVHEHSPGPLTTAQLGFQPTNQGLSDQAMARPRGQLGWESGGDRADQREVWRCGEGRRVPGYLLLPASCRVPAWALQLHLGLSPTFATS